MALINNSEAQIQMNSWVVPGQIIDFTGVPSATALPALPANSLTNSYAPANGWVDANGALLFYVIHEDQGGDLRVFDPDGIQIAAIREVTSNLEVAIVPVPEQTICTKFYIVYLANEDVIQNVELNFVTVNLKTRTVSSPTLIKKYGLLEVGAIAISKLKTNDTRFVYCVADFGFNMGVDQFVLDKNGITSVGSATLPLTFFAALEMDLSHDETMLAMTTGDADVLVVDLDGTGLPVSFDTYTISGLSSRGVEFSADGNSLYVCMNGTTQSNRGINVIDLTAPPSPTTFTHITGSEDYINTQIELAQDGNMYVGKSTGLGSIDVSNNLTVDAIPFNNLSISSSISFSDHFLLPDQVDGETYDLVFDCPTIFKEAQILPSMDLMHARQPTWADYDNDNDLDLFIPVGISSTNNPTRVNILYQNNCNGDFTRITQVPEGVVTDAVQSQRAVLADVDNDGDLDLYVTNNTISQVNNYYTNNGDGTFTKNTTDIIATDVNASRGAVFADFDNDGNLDLFVCNDDPGLLGNPQKNTLYFGDGTGSFTKVLGGDIDLDIDRATEVATTDFDLDGFLDLVVTSSAQLYLYRNNHSVSPRTFTRVLSGPIATEVFAGTAFNAEWVDYDNDLDMDLFIARSGFSENFLYRNDGIGNFTKMTALDVGVLVSDLEKSEGGSTWGDVDNDGDLDVYVANVEQNSLYLNDGQGFFTREDEEIVSLNQVKDSKGAVFADYDNDGDLDLLVGNNSGNPAPDNDFYENNGNVNNWLNIKCVGTTSNRSAIGTRISIRADINGNSVWQTREVHSYNGHQLNTHFGFGPAAVLNEIRIIWPSGLTESINGINLPAFDQHIEVVEGSGVFVSISACIPDLPPSNPAMISGEVKLDINENCTYESGTDIDLSGMLIECAPGHYAFTTGGFFPGSYGFIGLSPGSYTIKPEPFSIGNYIVENCSPAAELEYNLTVTANDIITGKDFFVKFDQQICDIEIVAAGAYDQLLDAPCPGIFQSYCFNFKNGGFPLTNAVISIEFPDANDMEIFPFSEQFCSSFNLNNSTNIWTCTAAGTFAPNEEFSICGQARTSSSAALGATLTTVATMSGDCNGSPVSFSHTLTETISCSLDPNDKLLAAPDGCGPENNIDKTAAMVYQVRFQNVGNANATNVLIRDELDPNLDLGSFKVVGSSHSITNIQIIPDNALLVYFDNIQLPPESTDPVGSNGFLVFSLNPKSGLPDGTVISNQAQIFFDLNEAIITNNVRNTLRTNPFPVAMFSVDHPCDLISNEFDFTYTGGTADNASFLWDFGSGATPATSTAQDPSGVTFDIDGIKEVTLTVTRFGCVDEVT
ncbi:MAG: CRTAC1 family protein, partial [Colwellia sp.]|nr:CRTAC1 family protein [Colwellia sp.]